MAVIYAEDWAAGPSLFETVYRYNRTGVSSEAQDPLYPFMWVAEGVYINPDGRLDKDPAYTGPFETYQTAGVWFKGMGPETTTLGSGYWNAGTGCIQVTYYPTEESLVEAAAFDAPLVATADRFGSVNMGVTVDVLTSTLDVFHNNEGSHDYLVEVTGAPMPVAGEAYTVRLGWQCGTFDPVEETVTADGFVRVWVNGELAYEATGMDLRLIYPFTYMVDPPNMIDSVQFSYFGMLGPLDSFSISDSACSSVAPIVFKSGRTSSPLAFSKILLKVVE